MIPDGYISIREAHAKLTGLVASDADGRLIFLLSNGKLLASYFDSQLEKRDIGPGYWHNLDIRIRELIFTKGGGIHGEDNNIIENMVVLESDLDALVSPKANPPYAEQSEPNLPAKRGRPNKYDGDAIWAGIVLAIHEGGEKQPADDIIKRVQNWCTDNFGDDAEPSRGLIQTRVAKVLTILRGGKPSNVFPEFLRLSKSARTRSKKSF